MHQVGVSFHLVFLIHYEIAFDIRANLPGQLKQKTAPLYNYDDISSCCETELNKHAMEVERADLTKPKQRRVALQATKVNMSIFNKVDNVSLRNEKAGKLDSLWAGLCAICEINRNGSTVITELSEKNKKMRVHVNILKVYQSRGEWAGHNTYGKIKIYNSK